MLAKATENVIVRSVYHQVLLVRIPPTALRFGKGKNMICCFNPRRSAQIHSIYVQHQKKVQSPKLYFMDTLGGGGGYFTAHPCFFMALRTSCMLTSQGFPDELF